MCRECVLLERGEVFVAVVLCAGRDQEEWDAEEGTKGGSGEGEEVARESGLAKSGYSMGLISMIGS